MISAGDRDEIKGLGLGLGLGLGRRREMVESELEEGEAYSYQNREDYDATVDPDVALSYIDDKIQDVLGHFQKDFEGGVSAENLGAKFGGYGSFLPTYQRSPAWTHPRTPHKNHTQNSPRSPNNFNSEIGQGDAVQCSAGAQLSRLGPGSATSSRLSAIKGLSLDDGTNHEKCPAITNAEALNSKYDSLNTKAGSISDQKPLKVRIKNAAIYSGLGLDVSPSPSPDDSPSESEGISRGHLDDPFEFPTSIIKIMTTLPKLLSPLPDDLIELIEKEMRTRDSIPGLVHIDDKESSGMLPNESNAVKGDRKLFGGKRVKSLQGYESSMEVKGFNKKNTRNDVGGSSRKEQNADALNMEELVSKTMKNPLLSNSYPFCDDPVKDADGPCNSLKEAKGAVKEKTLSDQAQKEQVDHASAEVNGFSERAKGGSGRKVVGDKVLLDDTIKAESNVSKVRTTSNTECVEQPPKTVNQRGSLGEQDSTALPFLTEHPYPGGKKKSKGMHDTMVIEREKENLKVGSSLIPKPKRSSDDSYTSKNGIEDVKVKVQTSKNGIEDVKVQKSSEKARDAYRDFFGELEEDEDKFDSLETPYEDKPKESEAAVRSVAETNLGAKERSGGKKIDKPLAAEVNAKTATNGWCTGSAPSTVVGNGNGVPAMLPPVEMEDNWVQCDRCHKWRLLPAGKNPESLPEKWLCSMLNWLPDMNRCSFSEDETTKALFSLYQGHSLDAQNNLQNVSGSILVSGTGATLQHPGQRQLNNDMHAAPGGKKKVVKEISNSSNKEGVSQYSHSIKKNPQSSVKSRSLNDVNKSPVVSEADAPGEKHKNKPRMPEYNSDRGDVKNMKSRRDPDEDGSRPSKKSKTDLVQSADKEWIPEQNGTSRKVNHSSNNTLPTTSAGKDRSRQRERSSSSDSKFGKDRPPVSAEKRKDKGRDSLDEGSLDLGNYGSNGSVKKRKLKDYQDAQTRSTGNPFPHESRTSEQEFSDSRKEKKARNSRSEGKESSASKGSGRTDKKVGHTKNHSSKQNPGSNHSHRSMDGMESSKRDSGSVQVSVAATSSSSKVSGSHKTKASFQEMKGSPVESVSSSPLRILSTDKFSNREVMGKDVPRDIAAVDSPKRCLDGEDDGASDRSETARKEKSFSMAHRSVFQGKGVNHISDTKPKAQTTSHYTNGSAEIMAPNGTYPGAEQIKDQGEDRTGVHYANASVSHARKTGMESDLEENKQGCKSEPPEVKVKSSSSPSQLPDQSPLCETKRRDGKVKLQDKFGLKPDQNENIHASKKDLTGKNESRKKENHGKRERDSQEVRVEALSKWEPLHAPSKNQLADCDAERSSKRSLLERPDQEVLGKGKSQVEILSHCPRPVAGSHRVNGDMEVDPSKADDASKLQKKQLKKADHQNGTQQIGSKNHAVNGHRSKELDAPSPLRKDSYTHAANNAVREAKDLKHLADRLKNSGSAHESTNLYFQAALKFLHGASLLESGNNDNAKHSEMIQSKQMYSSTAKLCEFCAHEYEKSKDMASAALAYKCTEVAYMRVIYSSHTSASRDRYELQTALQMTPLGESPSSSASDVDNVNNSTAADKVALSKSVNSPHVAGNHVIAARSRPNFVRILGYAQDVNFAMEASRKSRNAFAAADASMGVGKNADGISSIKKALDFSFQDVEGLLRLVRLAVEVIHR
ncbi:cysteine-tryptophan domain-containing zinc finger protein 3 [Lathyrus oleraceus]|uniref:CW-type domain-containing protein n=1 Tax=Pisum sativum TaxID=3888 RepID=A0A9D4XS34_PEA|nr:cysteine-tryptophan domain-containing zinc finger protein 3 [Pisum sativum]KAI5425074.1 hypothetical protein KIW84_031031 [Pisum sativum]